MGGVLLWMINDLRLHVRRSVDTVNHDLPQILEKTHQTAENLALLSQDVKQLRELVVGDEKSRDNNLVTYETELLRAIANSGGKIGVKKTLSSGLGEAVPAKEWVVRERKTALWDLARARSKADLLDRVGHSNLLGRTWYIETASKEILPLIEWAKVNHPASRELEGKTDEQ